MQMTILLAFHGFSCLDANRLSRKPLSPKPQGALDGGADEEGGEVGHQESLSSFRAAFKVSGFPHLGFGVFTIVVVIEGVMAPSP